MYGNPQALTEEAVQELRRQGGAWLRSLREAAGLSQSELAAQLEVGHYTLISQIETARKRVPPDRYRDWAEALGMRPLEFIREYLRYYDPMIADILDNPAGRALGYDKPETAGQPTTHATSPTFKDLVLERLQSAHPEGLTAREIQASIEAQLGRPFHFSNAQVTLNRYARAGVVRREGRVWVLEQGDET